MKLGQVPKTWICLGRILRPHGIRGALNVKLGNPNSESLRPGLVIHLQKSNGRIEDYTVKSLIDGRLLTLADIDDRNAAEKLVHSDLYVDRSDFPEIDEEDIYLSDMIGFKVADEAGSQIGSVIGFSDNGAQLLVEVRLVDGKVGLIPYVKPLVVKVDQNTKQLIVDIPQGLFDND